MGIDASTSSSGWSIFQDSQLIDCGVIKPKQSNDWKSRIKEEWGEFSKLLQKYSPTYIYAEDVPLKDGSKTILKLGAVQGMIIALGALFNIDIIFLSPSEWRGELNIYDGTREGTHRDILKKKAIDKVNKTFDLDLKWIAPKSKKNEDDIAEAILICYSQVKNYKIGKCNGNFL